MVNYTISTCPKCGKRKKLMFSNNPLSGNTISAANPSSNIKIYNVKYNIKLIIKEVYALYHNPLK